MFRAFVRGAVGFTFAMLVAAVLYTALGFFLDPITKGLAGDHLLVQTLEGAQTLAPVVAFLAVLVELLAGGIRKQIGGI